MLEEIAGRRRVWHMSLANTLVAEVDVEKAGGKQEKAAKEEAGKQEKIQE